MGCPSGTVNVLAVAGVRGDGIHDDTAGLQAALDSGAGTVLLPKPPGAYLISRTLVIHSGQTLLADRHAVIRLRDKADAHMLTNADHRGGDRGIKVVGGIWDGNNAGQTPHSTWPKTRELRTYLGVQMQFHNVQDLYVGGMTLKDPETYSLQLAAVRRFTVEDITFDHNMLRGNMDGVHVHGPAREGLIANIKGATNDDQVALNADDSPRGEISRGPITDVRIDGVWAEKGYTAVRLLSAGSPVGNIRISNIFGTYRYHVVSFTHHNVHPGEPSTFDNVSIDGVLCSKPPPSSDRAEAESWAGAPPFWFAPGTRTGSVVIRDYHRIESNDSSPDSIVVAKDARVDHLAVSDASLINRGASGPGLLTNSGEIRSLHMTSIRVRAEVGKARGHVFCNRGALGQRFIVGVSGENVAGVEL